ncbi:MAG: hypothetical protein NTX00_02885 [Candidatus Parcubacteria bacterium]|nr:hypothetical protein [Candidatus Parcubacteria bacterium]
MKKKQMLKKNLAKHSKSQNFSSATNSRQIQKTLRKTRVKHLWAIVIGILTIGIIAAIIMISNKQANKARAYTKLPLEGQAAVNRFMQLLAILPDDNARNNLLELINHKGLKVSLYRSGAMQFDAKRGKIDFNPVIFSKPDGYTWAYLVHENRHIEDWLGKHESGKMYAPCELERYASYECKIEYWAAEYRASLQQAIFLKQHNLVWTMPAGPFVNNRLIFEKYSSQMAALIFVKENYYADKSYSPDLLAVFPEFYNKKLAEISQ